MEIKDIENHTLSHDEIQQLDDIVKGDDPYYVRYRAHAILLIFGDHRDLEDVADIFKVHINTIRNWIERWLQFRIDGLYDLAGRGSKPIFTEAEEKLITKYVEEEPRSLRRVAAIVEKMLGKNASIATLRRIIKKHGKSWKRQRKIPKRKPTKEEYEQGLSDLQELKYLAQDGEFDLFYFDATGFTLQPCVPYAWQNIGKDGTLGIPSSNSKRINLLGFLNPATHELTCFERIGKVNSDIFIDVVDAFCDNIRNPVVVVLDNASIHTSKSVEAKIEEWDKRGVTLYNLPRYSPELNTIEIVWRKIKYEWVPNLAYTSIEALDSAISNIVRLFGSEYDVQFS
jgi:transposase